MRRNTTNRGLVTLRADRSNQNMRTCSLVDGQNVIVLAKEVRRGSEFVTQRPGVSRPDDFPSDETGSSQVLFHIAQ